MKITIEFDPPKCCFLCKWAKYINHDIKHKCLIFEQRIDDYRYGNRLQICKDKEKEE